MTPESPTSQFRAWGTACWLHYPWAGYAGTGKVVRLVRGLKSQHKVTGLGSSLNPPSPVSCQRKVRIAHHNPTNRQPVLDDMHTPMLNPKLFTSTVNKSRSWFFINQSVNHSSGKSQNSHINNLQNGFGKHRDIMSHCILNCNDEQLLKIHCEGNKACWMEFFSVHFYQLKPDQIFHGYVWQLKHLKLRLGKDRSQG